MSSFYQEIASLSADDRRVFEMLLREQGVDPAALILPQGRGAGTFPLSFAQQRLWFLDQLQPGSPFYNIPAAVRLAGPLDIASLERSLNDVLLRHEVLRTVFVSEGGLPRQVVQRPDPAGIAVTDLTALPAPDRLPEALRLARERASEPFDLGRGPLLRTWLLRLAADDHLLVLAVHHIAADIWSLGLLMQEIGVLYSAHARGMVARLPELPVQYADFAVWQRKWLRGQAREEQLQYWRRQLAGAPALLDLPADRPRPAVQAFRGAHQRFRLGRSVAASLLEFSQRERVTPYMTILAAFNALLSGQTRQRDIVVGSPVANRSRREVEGLIGFFANTLVLRTDVSGDPSFRDLVGRVRDVCVGAYAHQDIPFEQIVEDLQPGRALSHSPLFQVMFVFQNAPLVQIELPHVTMTQVEIDSGMVHFDLTLRAWQTATGLEGRFEYNTDLFDPATIRRMCRRFQRILAIVARDPDRRVSNLTSPSRYETRKLLSEWGAGPALECAPCCVDELVEQQAARTPASIAIEDVRTRLTYGELDVAADRLARRLAETYDVGPETPVAVWLPRTVQVPIAALAIWKAGGVFVPIDANWPVERAAAVLADAAAKVLITDTSTAMEPAGGAAVLRIDQDAAITAGPAAAPPRRTLPANAACIVYTSGTTGSPRGVVITHAGLSRYVRAIGHELGIAPEDRYLHTASFAFSSSFRQLLVPLTRGGTLVIADAGQIADPAGLLRFVASSGATVCDLVPSYWRACAEALQSLPSPERTALLDNKVRLTLSASEPLPPSLPAFWRSVLRHPAALVNMFGQTETTGIVAMHRIGPADESAARCVSIGRPLANTQLYVLDRAMRPVLPGTPGEIHIGGSGLARGYWGRPKETAARFVPNPFGAPGTRLYRTGDLARFSADGTVNFLGREDHQVKIRGVRVELAEIEAQLARHDDIREAVVTALPGDGGAGRLVAYVVPKRSPGPHARALRAFLGERLPSYMLPPSFVVLEALPRTSTGKIDRRALPPPPVEGTSSAGPAGAPRTPTEEMLAGIWQELLRIDRPSIHADFFELGGHSLLATQVVSRIRDAFGIELPIRTLFESSTIAGLAEVVDTGRAALDGVHSPPIRRAARDGDFLPASFSQERLWFLDRLQPGNSAYVIPAALRLSGPLDRDAFERSLNDVIARHESLRSCFRSVDGRACVAIRPRLVLDVPVIDLREHPADRRAGMALELASEEAGRPFDLERDPLIRATLLRISEEEHVLLLCVHHIVADGWSIGILVGELTAAYAARLRGDTASGPGGLPLQYADFAAWQREWLTGETLERQLVYWRERLGGAEPILAIPTDSPRPAVQDFRGARRPVRISKELTGKLLWLGRQCGATLFMTLLAAFQVLLARYAGQRDVTVGTPIAGRTRRELEPLVGLFVNTLPLRCDLGGNPSFRDVLAQVRSVTLGAYAHQDTPFEKLIEALQPGRITSHTPLVQVMFALQNVQRPPLSASGLRVRQIDVHNSSTKFDLTLGLAETSSGLWGSIEYRTELFSAATIARLCAHFETLLERVVSDPDCRIWDVPLMQEAERRQVLRWGRGRASDYGDRPMHQVFETHAARRPDAVAVTCRTERLTYRDLDAQANRLARHLEARGVGPETVVGVLLERSPAAVIALLAILKAGAAYLPLDPSYPAARLRFMAQDARATLVVTQASLAAALNGEVETICLDAERRAIDSRPPDAFSQAVSLDNLAYVTYTSGSTGTPKGVAIPHRGVLRLLLDSGYARFGPREVLVQLAPLPFDAATLEIWGALLHGGHLVIFPGRVPAPRDLEDLIARHGVTTMWLTGSLFNTVMDEAPHVLRGLGQLLVGGEPLSVRHVRQGLRELPGTTVINGYGPTENTTFTTCHMIPADLAEGVPSIPIGRPIERTDVRLLDARGEPVPVGVVGELYVGGDGLARGYQHRPGLTAERFVPDPFGNGDRLYRTGDRARWRADGALEFLGRTDHQVKVRGMRVEVAEIETVLRQHPAVRDAAVVVHDIPPIGPRLAAHVVPRREPAVPMDELRSFLQARLPEHMVPAVFVPRDTLPLSANQKLDRTALTLDEGTPHPRHFTAPPRTETEHAIAAIWSELLGRSEIGIHDNFFELGGHSLLATRFVSRVNVRLGVSLPLRTVFDTPTIAVLAEHVDTLRWATASSLAVGSGAAGEEEAGI